MFKTLTVLSTVVAYTHADGATCEQYNWQKESEALGQINTILGFAQSSGMLKSKLEAFDPLKLDGKVLGSAQKSFLGLDFQITATAKTGSVTGLKSVTISPINATSESSLDFGVALKDPLNVAMSLDLEIKQLTLTGCKDDEEEYLGLCYKKCSLLTGGEYYRRTATNTCARDKFPYLWTKGLGCNGFGVSSGGGCATPYLRPCLTNLFDKKCSPKTISMDVAVGIENAALDLDMLLAMMKCPTAYPSPDCKDVTVNDIMIAAITGQLEALVNRIFLRFQKVQSNSFSLSFNKITTLEFSFKDESKIAKAIGDWLLSFSKDEVNKKGSLYALVTKTLNGLGKKAVNDMIQKQLAPKFGATCMDKK